MLAAARADGLRRNQAFLRRLPADLFTEVFMAGKKTLAKNKGEKKADVLTKRVCAVCQQPMLASQIRAKYEISFVGAKSSSRLVHHHAKCV